MDILIIIISLILLMFFAYRGYSLIFIAPVFAILAAITSDYASMPLYSELFMTKAAEYIKSYYPIFLFGAIFAKIMSEGGLASSVASIIVKILGKDRAILAILIGSGILTYGGLSVFVVAFVMYPFAAILFKQSDIPKRLLPGLLWMGIFTYSMVSLPGTPQIQNIIPASVLGTSTWSGIGLGLLASFLFFIIGYFWISYRAKTLKAKGEGYGRHYLNEPENNDTDLPDWRLSIIPLVLVILINLYISNPFKWQWAFHFDENMLDTFKMLNLSLIVPNVAKVQAIWSINISLIISSIVAAIIGRKKLRRLGGVIRPINSGAIDSTSAVLNVASGYAFGAVIAALPIFVLIKDALLNLQFGDNPLFSAIITTNIMVAITGSSSSGLMITISNFGVEWLNWANQIGMSPDVLHRIICIASEGIDSMPHAGALVTLIAVCGLTHRESYYDVFILTLLKFGVAFICMFAYMLFGLV